MERDKMFHTVDLLLFSISDGEYETCRSLVKKKFSILLIKRTNEPYKNSWSLPGGYLDINETMIEAADRVLKKETSLTNIYKEQLYTFDGIDRDLRGRTLSTSYLSLIDKNKLNQKISDYSSWFNIEIKDSEKYIEVSLINNEESFTIKANKILKDKTTNMFDYDVVDNGNLGFDHALIILVGIARIKNKIKDTDIAFNLVPKEFTLGELQQVYEIILGKKLIHSAFRRIICDKVVKTNKIVKTGGHRPSSLYRYKGGK